MDCKPESAVKTCLRIELLILQGLLLGIGLFLVGVLAMPFVPFAVVVNRWRLHIGKIVFLKRLLLMPIWFVSGMAISMINPFGILFNTFSDTIGICIMEWLNRWTTGKPKRPNGHPLRIRSEKEIEASNVAIAQGVMADYGFGLGGTNG